MKKYDLKPCPFCGGETKVYSGTKFAEAACKEIGCGASIKAYRGPEEDLEIAKCLAAAIATYESSCAGEPIKEEGMKS